MNAGPVSSRVVIGQLKLQGEPWDAVGGLNFANMGFVVVGAFVVTWVGAFAIFKLRRVDEFYAIRIEYFSANS